MPAFVFPRNTTETASDPYGIDQVNGFYGSGAWASWIIALMSSWISIFKGERRLTYDLIASLLYTNWAGIDLLRQFYHNEPSLGPIAAAVFVAYSGFANIVLQYCYMLNANIKNDRDSSMVERVIGAATILPWSGVLLVLFYLTKNEELMQTDVHGKLYGDLVTYHFQTAMKVGAVGTIVVVTATSIYASTDPGSMFRLAGTTFPITSVFASIIIAMFSIMVYVYFLFEILRTNAERSDCYFLIPCTTQSISDWDQAFALVCALVMVVKEMGPGVYRAALRYR
ncbi:hypothetical protein DE146DRAFT_671815 [Phaeosphaeria sp. MPI-PUGE-AT-0046c]|nr:hypothetical protein DE146DRAFT_671815 [Phaeosphaeria sp. MPI-PUGE-AT-0046c]